KNWPVIFREGRYYLGADDGLAAAGGHHHQKALAASRASRLKFLDDGELVIAKVQRAHAASPPLSDLTMCMKLTPAGSFAASASNRACCSFERPRRRIATISSYGPMGKGVGDAGAAGLPSASSATACRCCAAGSFASLSRVAPVSSLVPFTDSSTSG